MSTTRSQILRVAGTTALLILGLVSSAAAYPQWSQNHDATNCRACHGDFRSNLYTSLVDGQLWGNLHNIHRQTMLNGDCQTCHSPGGTFPVLLNSSGGGDGLEPIACVGCHGRAEDYTADNPDFPASGYAAGLRQHHYNAGVMICADCHDDANPANFTPAGEATLPPYYANPGNNHPNIPDDPCNADGSENFAGDPIGLDNDGNQLYDGDDPGCSGTSVPDVAALGPLFIENHPNPFHPETVIQYTIAAPGLVRVSIYSLTGQLVERIVDREVSQAGSYTAVWRGTDRDGRDVAAGVYLCRLEAEGGIATQRMVLLR